jgi:hypothetical protein
MNSPPGKPLLLVTVLAGLVLTAGACSSTPVPDSWSDAAATASGAAQMSTASPNVALGQHMAASYGWGGGEQWSCLDALWTHVSRWNPTATSKTSAGRGIAQNPNGWSATYSYDNARQQIAWGLAYIDGEYFWPCAAWLHVTSAGWY